MAGIFSGLEKLGLGNIGGGDLFEDPKKKEAAKESLGTSIGSIIVSGLCFFGATFGVGFYSKIEMIGALCTLMARGAIVSMLTVICVLPAFLIIFDKLICKTTLGMKKKIRRIR